MPSPKNHQEAYSNIYHMQQSIDRLLVASKDWKPEDAVRGEKTLMRLELQIARTKAELQLNR
jgi:hypothetical protein